MKYGLNPSGRIFLFWHTKHKLSVISQLFGYQLIEIDSCELFPQEGEISGPLSRRRGRWSTLILILHRYSALNFKALISLSLWRSI